MFEDPRSSHTGTALFVRLQLGFFRPVAVVGNGGSKEYHFGVEKRDDRVFILPIASF